MRWISLTAFTGVLLAALPAQSLTQQDWFTKAVKNVTASFEPAEAKPGQTVTFRLTVDLNDGYITYPLVQADKAAASNVNTLLFPAAGAVIFVGEASDPPKLPTKAEPIVGITEMRYCPGGVTYTRKAVVSPKAAPGDVKVAMAAFKINVCYEDRCYPEKTVPVEATLKVLDGPAVEVEKAYADEVAKALAGK